jgi:hypothetical protein
MDVLENEQHMWLECRNNGQDGAWAKAREIWGKTTTRNWPDLSLGLIKGAAALSFEYDQNKDSERLRILISMTIWAIWKTRNKNSINNQEVSTGEAREELVRLLKDLITKSWNATRFLEGGRRKNRQRALRTLWAEMRLVDFDPKTGPAFDFP